MVISGVGLKTNRFDYTWWTERNAAMWRSRVSHDIIWYINKSTSRDKEKEGGGRAVSHMWHVTLILKKREKKKKWKKEKKEWKKEKKKIFDRRQRNKRKWEIEMGNLPMS